MTTENAVLDRAFKLNGHELNGMDRASADVLVAPRRAPRRAPSRKAVLRVFVITALVAGIVAAASWWAHARHYESTDDAFIEGRVIPVAAKVEGYVVSLNVDDNQHVSAGDIIAEVDARDYQAALTEAQASVAAARSRLADANAKLAVFDAQVRQANAALAATIADADFSKFDADRYRSMSTGAASEQERQRSSSVQRADEAKVDGARSNVIAAESQAKQGRTSVAVAESEVAAAEAKVRQPELNLGYTKIIAPQSGRIARRTVEQGSYVKTGQTLLAIVSDDVWVIANFKETQLTEMKPGQSVALAVDMYPDQKFSGHVDSIQPGTGGRFSLLPPENATGNFVKVVQRLPVKIRLDGPADARLLLAPGMSVFPEVLVR